MVAGFLGPEIARRTADLSAYGAFTAPFFIMTGLYLLAVGVLFFLRYVKIVEAHVAGENRPLKVIARQPQYIAAVLSGTAAYGVMSFIMTATPLQMHSVSHFSLDATALVIQSHIIAMYFPSLFTGFLIERLGLVRLMLLGVLAMLLTIGIGVVSREVLHYWWALVLLGIGWNFLFVGGTVLLTWTYFPAERFRAQGANDFTIFGMQALASLSAGSVLFLANWDVLLMITFPVLIGIGLLVWRLNGHIAQAGSVRA
jgi:MFS family permease